jgi:diadenosine tetraphosphate (Ap4A) HIT family hydrolase
MANATIEKFGYPKTLIAEYKNWVVLLRPAQVTVGSLVMACKLESTKMSELPADVFAELAQVTRDIENTLTAAFSYDKINYLLLMMVDKHVHFHVLPRYETKREVAGVTFVDAAWPTPPDLSKIASLTDAQFQDLHRQLKDKWPRS